MRRYKPLCFALLLLSMAACAPAPPAQEATVRATDEGRAYTENVSASITSIAAITDELLPLLLEAQANPSLLRNSSWLSNARTILANFSLEVSQLAGYSAPASQEELGIRVKLLEAYLASFVTNFSDFLDTRNIRSLQSATRDLENFERVLDLLLRELQSQDVQF